MTGKEVVAAYKSGSLSQKEALEKIAEQMIYDPQAYTFVDEIIGMPSELERDDTELARNWERNKRR